MGYYILSCGIKLLAVKTYLFKHLSVINMANSTGGFLPAAAGKSSPFTSMLFQPFIVKSKEKI